MTKEEAGGMNERCLFGCLFGCVDGVLVICSLFVVAVIEIGSKVSGRSTARGFCP